jgi:hypothetical protein
MPRIRTDMVKSPTLPSTVGSRIYVQDLTTFFYELSRDYNRSISDRRFRCYGANGYLTSNPDRPSHIGRSAAFLLPPPLRLYTAPSLLARRNVGEVANPPPPGATHQIGRSYAMGKTKRSPKIGFLPRE